MTTQTPTPPDLDGAEAGLTCKTCRFFALQEPQHVYGDCHRLPPQFGFYANFHEDTYERRRYRVDIQRERGDVWPNISQDEWCGEHQPATTATEQTYDRK